MAFHRAGRPAEAEPLYRAVVDALPDNADALHLLGLALSEQDRFDDALALIERAIELNPDAAPFRHNIAGIYRRVGRISEAAGSYRRAIELKADYVQSYQGLVETVALAPGDPIEAQVNGLLARDLPDEQATYLHFALGKFYDDTGNYREAFAHYTAGNQKAGRHFDSESHTRQVQQVIDAFSPQLIERLAGSGMKTRMPLFVVGMPRSGTTLVEQILASHPDVYGAGELNDMKRVVRQLIGHTGAGHWVAALGKLNPGDVAGLAGCYIKQIRPFVGRAPGIRRVVDKHPLNFQYIGLILLMFPNACIVHTVRDALDTCLSCYFQNFTRGQDYSFDLRTLGRFFLDYRRLMAHWDMVFPGRIHHLDYKTLVDNQESETRALLRYCRLPLDPACLRFHETQRAVQTASFQQVRQPIFRHALGRHAHYAEQLEVLRAQLTQPS